MMLLWSQVESAPPPLQPARTLLGGPVVRCYATASRHLPQEKAELLQSMAGKGSWPTGVRQGLSFSTYEASCLECCYFIPPHCGFFLTSINYLLRNTSRALGYCSHRSISSLRGHKQLKGGQEISAEGASVCEFTHGWKEKQFAESAGCIFPSHAAVSVSSLIKVHILNPEIWVFRTDRQPSAQM